MNHEIDIIKKKGIDKYLSDMYIRFDTNDFQYLVNENQTSNIGRILVVNNHENNINENFNKDFNINIINNNININDNYFNNYDYSNFENQNLSPCRLGLENIGATCYMNATLQCLCNIIQLQNYFLNNKKLFQNPKAKLSKAFADVLINLYKKNKKSFAPNKFKELIGKMNPLFRGIAANDSKDLILFLYETIHDELNIKNNYNCIQQNISNELQIFRKNYYTDNSSIIQETFYFEQITIVVMK